MLFVFKKGKYINLNDLLRITHYISGYLISWLPNRNYFECQYNYISKLTLACHWKQKRGLPVCSKKGEAICDGKLLNLFEDKQHKNCICSIV